MKFFFDNNLSRDFTDCMKYYLGYDVVHLTEVFDPATKDVEWLRYIGENNMILITRDKKIRYNPTERTLLTKYNIGAFFLSGGHLKRSEIAQQINSNWEQMNKIADQEKKPFAYRIPAYGTKLWRLKLS